LAALAAARKRHDSYCPPILPALCLAFGALAFAIGQGIWTYYELVLNVPTPFPSWADAGYLAAYPFMFFGILSLPSNPTSINKKIVVVFESLMFMTGVLTFSWYYILGPTIFQTGESTLARVLGTAYPLSDLGLISCLLLLFLRSGGSKILPVAVTLAAGLVSIIGIDTIFDYQTLHNTYETGCIFDIGWPLGYMLIGAAGHAALKVNVKKREAVTPVPNIFASIRLRNANKIAEVRPVLVQYVVVTLVAGLVWVSSSPHCDHRLQAGVHIGAAIVVCLLMLRQFFTLVENEDLTKKMLVFKEDLEEVVKVRTYELGIKTEQLSALQALTSAINETLDTSRVISAAAMHTHAALNAAATAVWTMSESGDRIEPLPHKCIGMDRYSEIFRYAAESDVSNSATVQVITVQEDDGGVDGSFEYLQVALRCRGELLGKLGVVRAIGNFKDSDLKLLDSIGLHVATALENARQYWNARDAADRDTVTRLLNHRAIHEYLDACLDIESGNKEPVTVILADIDNFHMFNDTYGHPIGDDVLCKVAHIIDSGVNTPSKVGRYSGDEFILVLPDCDTEQSIMIAQKLQAAISNLQLRYGDEERTIPIGLSFGIASYPLDSMNRQDLLVTADSNLRSAKNSDAHIVALTEMKRAHRELRVSGSFRMLDGLVTAIDNKDRYTRRHSEDVTEYALLIAEQLDLDDEIKRVLRIGGLLHDVGKIGVPDEILRKPSRLNDEEYTVLKQHPVLGALIVRGVAGMEDIVDAVKYHHEHWDGTGYPEGLAATDIPFIARLVAVADAMSAMTTDRPYRKGLSIEKALEQIRKNTGTQFDPVMANAFLRIAEKRLAVTDNSGDSANEFPKAA
jgi:diguanylate cyclase (GGDEF)-like protein/putative nucleotidyltransferase with HDIG domain